MLPRDIQAAIQRIDNIQNVMNRASQGADTIIQNVFANHLALAAAGLVEISTQKVVGEYARQHGNDQVSRYIQKTVGWNNSLNCEKIETILNNFDKSWWPTMVSSTDDDCRAAVDSLKTLRDALSHGRPNGTGLVTISEYYRLSKLFVAALANTILK